MNSVENTEMQSEEFCSSAGGFYGSNPALNFGEDMNAARYRDGVRETLNGKASSHMMPLFSPSSATRLGFASQS